MPRRLTVCGCLTLPLAADDLIIPAAIGIFFRTFYLIASAVILAIGLTNETCPARPVDIAFLASTLFVVFIIFVLYVYLFRVTSKGGILDYEERTRKTIPIWHMLVVAYFLEVGIWVFGMVLITTTPCSFSSSLPIVELIAVIAAFIDFMILGVVILTLLYLTRGRKPRPLHESSYTKTIHNLLYGMSILCCGLFGNLKSPLGYQELAYSEISRVAHNFLKDTMTEFTVSDLFTAFLLLRFEQHANELNRVEAALAATTSPQISSPKNVRFKSQSFTASSPITGDTKALDALREFEEFAPYMIGIYGWKLQMYMSPLTFLSSFPKAMYTRVITGNDFEHAIFKSAIGGEGKKKRQILYSSFTSYLGEAIPYTITADHEKNAIIVTLRGTMSVSDIALDLLCEPESLNLASRQWGVPEGDKHYVHGGMLRVANRIRMDIEKQQILHRLLKIPEESEEQIKVRESFGDKVTQEDRDSFLKAMGKGKAGDVPQDMMYQREVFIGDRELTNMDCSNYRLIVCGHSLGSVSKEYYSLCN